MTGPHHVGQAHAVIAYRKHAGEEVVCGTHEDAAQDYPYICDRAEHRSHDCPENRPQSGNVQKLDDEHSPRRKGFVVYSVWMFHNRCFPLWIRTEKSVYEFSIKEVTCNEDYN